DPLQQPVLVTLAGLIAVCLFVGLFSLAQLMTESLIETSIQNTVAFLFLIIAISLLDIPLLIWIPPLVLVFFIFSKLTASNGTILGLGYVSFNLLWLSEMVLYYPVLFFLGIEISSNLLHTLLTIQILISLGKHIILEYRNSQQPE
ncbi:MAG: hypothetical protein ACXAE3_15905, partial [Candidatus Kariarchaeaceae archaeon]